MGKRNKFKYENSTIFFKKSNTICTQSRTCSGASQFCTRSGILHYKKKISQANDYYVQSGKIKRDLCIETDLCILRRYYKSKRNKLSTKDDINKLKLSNVITEIDTVKKLQLGACGDSTTMTQDIRQPDIATVIVENLKGLLTKWIQKHLLENKDKQGKIETVLHSIMHKGIETKVRKFSSHSTYIISREGYNYEVKNKQMETASLICDYCKHKCPIAVESSSDTKNLWSQSVPITAKKLRVLSTLSIPRKFKPHNIKSRYNPRKLLESSNFDLLAISTRSFTRRCATYSPKRFTKRRVGFDSNPLHKNVSNNTKTKKEQRKFKETKILELEDLSSLVKSIYAEHLANFAHTNSVNTQTSEIFTFPENNNFKQEPLNIKTNNSDKYTCNASVPNIFIERDRNECFIDPDFVNHTTELPVVREIEHNNTQENDVNIYSKKNIHLTKKRRSLKTIKPWIVRNKKFSQRKSGSRYVSNNEFLKHIQTILGYITKNGEGNLKFDINVSFLPVKGKLVDACSHISEVAIVNNVVNEPTETISNNTDSPKMSYLDQMNETPEIIALLDGAASHAKYIYNVETSKKSEPIKIPTEDHSTITSKLEMIQEIHDLKTVVKNLLHTAETLVSEQIKKETNKRNVTPFKINVTDIKPVDVLKPPNKPISQGIQISNDFAKNLHLAGIKLSKEPKKDTTEFCNRLMKKSTSYKIIESESVLRVTDMTLGGKIESSSKIHSYNIAKSKSLIDIKKDEKRVIAYYCDGSCNNISNCRQNNSVSFYKVSLADIKPKKKQNSISSCSCECNKLHTHQPVLVDSQESIPECPTSIYIDVEECCNKKCSIPARKGMGFGEGFIYCLLLWIPVTIIAGLFYYYVLKDIVYPSEHKVIGQNNNNATLYLKLSDLGF